MGLWILFSLWAVSLGLFGVSFADELTSKENEAYEHNRAGMANMSMARFEEAITEFSQAAALLPDYQISGRPLVYTPIFMTGWAYEKTGRLNEACRHYRKFLEIAPPEVIEETKAQHAREALEKCRHSG
jgi:tetratricopeptide (TPR) repeat protein